MTHLLKFLGKMYRYEMDPTRIVGVTERTCDAGWIRDRCGMDGRTDRWTDGRIPIYPQQLHCAKGIIIPLGYQTLQHAHIEPIEIANTILIWPPPLQSFNCLPWDEAETKWPPFSRWFFQCTFLNENVSILTKISLKFVPRVLINNIPALVPIMAWCRPGDKPLSEPMMVLSTEA